MFSNRFFALKHILVGVLGLTVLMSVLYLAQIPPFDTVNFSLNPFEDTEKLPVSSFQETLPAKLFSVNPNAEADEVVLAALAQLKNADLSDGLSLRNADKLSLSESYFSETAKSYPVKWLLDNQSFALVSKREQDSLFTHVRIALYDVKSTPRGFTFVLKKNNAGIWKIEQVLYEP